MSQSYLCIGGPYDGKITETPGDAPYLEYVEVESLRPIKFIPSMDISAPLLKRSCYERQYLMTKDGHIAIMVDENITLYQAMKKLIEGYSPMPSTSKKQEKFMRAVAHDKKFAGKVGVPQAVGKEFAAADKAKAAKKSSGKKKGK